MQARVLIADRDVPVAAHPRDARKLLGHEPAVGGGRSFEIVACDAGDAERAGRRGRGRGREPEERAPRGRDGS